MTKDEFLLALGSRLSGVPAEDRQRSLEYYSESIDDRMEDGLTQEEAVAAMGSLDEILVEILSDVSLGKIVKEKVAPKGRRQSWEIVLLVLGAPLWLSVGLTIACLVVSAYLLLWTAVACLYAVTLTLGICGAAGVTGMAFLCARGELLGGLLLLGGGLVCAGLTILAFHLSNLAAKGSVALCKAAVTGVKRLFIGKERA